MLKKIFSVMVLAAALILVSGQSQVEARGRLKRLFAYSYRQYQKLSPVYFYLHSSRRL